MGRSSHAKGSEPRLEVDPPGHARRQEKRGGPRRSWRLSAPVAVVTVALVVIVAPVGYVWHSHQVEANAAAFLEQADRMQVEENWRGAAGALNRYARLNPNDDTVAVRIAQVSAKGAQTRADKERTANLYFKAVGLFGERLDLRGDLGELLLELRRYDDAEEQAVAILEQDDVDKRGLRVMAHALRGMDAIRRLDTRIDPRSKSKYSQQDLYDAYAAALAQSPGDIELSEALATVYRTHAADALAAPKATLIGKADAVMFEMTRIRDDDAAAHLAMFRYQTQYGVEGADKSIRLAIELGGQDIEVLLAAGDAATNGDDFDSAERNYLAAVEAAPLDRRGYANLGRIYNATNRTADQIAICRKGIEAIHRDDYYLEYLLALGLLADGQYGEVEKSLTRLNAVIKKTPFIPGADRTQALNEVDFVRAKLHIAKQEFSAAIPLLRAVAASTSKKVSDLEKRDRARTLELLGNCYGRLGKWDQAATAHTQAAILQPTHLRLKMSAAQAWRLAGRVDQSAKLYEDVARAAEPPPTVWAPVAQARLQEELGRKLESRDWQKFDDALKQAKQFEPFSADVALLEVQSAALRVDANAGVAMLDSLLESHPAPEQLLRSAVAMYERLARPDRADEALARLRSALPKSLETARAESQLLIDRSQFAEARDVLELRLTLADDDDERATLLRSVAALDRSLGDDKRALERLRDSVGRFPFDVPLLFELSELAMRARDFPTVVECEDRLRTLEGGEGTVWRYVQATRLLTTPRDSQRADTLQQITTLVTEIESLRPEWPLTFVLRGRVAVSRGQHEDAIASYKKAIEVGSRDIGVYEPLVMLLIGKKRIPEAVGYLNQIPESLPMSENLTLLAIPSLLRHGDPNRAVAIARAGASKRPDDAPSQTLLGHALLIRAQKGDLDEAEAAFRRAVDLDPNDGGTWLTLVGYLTTAGRADEAIGILNELANDETNTIDRKANVLAAGYDRVGDRETALRYFRQAVDSAPQDIETLDRFGRFLAKFDLDEAELMFREAVRLEPESAPARRRLAGLLATRGSEAGLDEAIKLLGGKDALSSLAEIDRRSFAVLLMKRRQPGDLRQAEAILTELIDKPSDPDDATSDRLLLARLQESQGQITEAKRTLELALKVANPQPVHMEIYVEFLLRNEQQLGEAGYWLDELERTAPATWARILLRGRFLIEMDRAAEVETLVESYLKSLLTDATTERQKAALVGAATVYNRLELYPAAERRLRDLAQLAPGNYQPLAEWLASQKRIAEALDLCIQAARDDMTAEDALILSHVMLVSISTDVDTAAAEPLLAEAVMRFAGNPRLVFNVATLRYLQGQGDQAIALYESLLKSQPKSVASLNNFALLLSDLGRHEEALTRIEEAIRIGGTSPELVDSKATILLNQGNPGQASELLQKLIADSTATARHQLHFAWACHQLGETEEAREAIRNAYSMKLNAELLTPAERTWLEQLETALAIDPAERTAQAPETSGN